MIVAKSREVNGLAAQEKSYRVFRWFFTLRSIGHSRRKNCGQETQAVQSQHLSSPPHRRWKATPVPCYLDQQENLEARLVHGQGRRRIPPRRQILLALCRGGQTEMGTRG